MQNFLILHTQAPHQHNALALAQDMTLALSCFEQIVRCVFIGDGVYQLKAGQQHTLIKRLSSYNIYDLTPVYICQQSMQARALELDDLLNMPIKLCSQPDLHQLLQDAQGIVSF